MPSSAPFAGSHSHLYPQPPQHHQQQQQYGAVLLPLASYENIFASAEAEIYDMLVRGPIARFLLSGEFPAWIAATMADPFNSRMLL